MAAGMWVIAGTIINMVTGVHVGDPEPHVMSKAMSYGQCQIAIGQVRNNAIMKHQDAEVECLPVR